MQQTDPRRSGGQLGKQQGPAGQLAGAQVAGPFPTASGSAGVMYPTALTNVWVLLLIWGTHFDKPWAREKLPEKPFIREKTDVRRCFRQLGL